MTEPLTQDAPARTALWVKLMLGLSLALNLAIAGFVLGAVIRHGGPGHHGRDVPGMRAFGAPYMLALPRDDRRAVLAGMKQHAGRDIPDRAARRAMFAEVVDALRGVPFDPATLRAAVARQSATAVAAQAAAQEAWLEVVSAMSDAERRAYAAEVEEVLRRRPRGVVH